jgi:hypothetical protein
VWRRAVSIVLALASAAGAQTAPPPPPSPPPAATAPRAERYGIGLGLVLGGGGPRSWRYGAWTLEAGVAILREPVRVRVRGFTNLAGGTLESDGSGEFKRYGGGVEVRYCTASDGLCGFADVDAGYQALTLEDDAGRLVRADRGLLVGPRLGIEAGGALRFRAAVEVYRQRTSEAVGSFTIGGLALGAMFQF